MRSAVLFTLGAMAATVSAQSVTLPASATSAAGSTVNAFPWGTTAATWPGLRIMCLYDSTHFTGAPTPVTQPILITHVKWRANDVPATTTWTGGTYSSASLSLGTAAVDYTAASTTWTANYGADYTTVYSGPVTVLPGSGLGVGVPGPIAVDITLSTPFLYDPTAGDLVVDTNFLTGTYSGGTQPGMDVSTTSLLATRVYSSSLYPNANGVDTNVPVVVIDYIPASPTAATNTNLGAGCVSVPDVSTYENFTTSTSFDLANTSISFLPTGNGYLALPGFSPYVPPSGTAQVLPLTDDSEVIVPLPTPLPIGTSSTSSLAVCSNGYISAATGNGVGFTPVPSTFLNGPQLWWSLCWHDFNPSIAGSGQIKFEVVGSLACVTWDGVWDYGGTSASNANTMQAQFDLGNGTVHFVYGATSTLGNGRLVGISPAGSSIDPGSMDISATLPSTYVAAQFAVVPLALTALSRPITGTNWNLQTTNVPAAGTIGIEVYGLSDPAINDLFFLGMPGCGLRASLDVLNAWIVTGPTHAYSLAIPNNPALVLQHVYTTSAVLVPGVNAFGAITSNGVDGRMGDN